MLECLCYTWRKQLYSSGKSIGFEIKNRVHILDSLRISCVTFGKLFNLSAGLFFINGQNMLSPTEREN